MLKVCNKCGFGFLVDDDDDGGCGCEMEEGMKKQGVKADEVQAGGSHYKDMPVEPWDLMQKVMPRDEFIGFLRGNMIKYALRAGRKPGVAAAQDVEKYNHYKKKLEEVEEAAW